MPAGKQKSPGIGNLLCKHLNNCPLLHAHLSREVISGGGGGGAAAIPGAAGGAAAAGGGAIIIQQQTWKTTSKWSVPGIIFYCCVSGGKV